jgi:hypothetical protein
MKDYLNICDVKEPSTQVAIASGYLKGGASTFWRSCCRNPNPPSDWASFVKVLKQRYQPLAASLVARAKLHALRQGNSNLGDHTTKFLNLVQLIDDMSESDQIFNFLRSLHPDIAKEIDTRELKSLHEAMTLAQRADTFIDNRRYYRPTPTSQLRPTSTSSPYVHSIPASSSTDRHQLLPI